MVGVWIAYSDSSSLLWLIDTKLAVWVAYIKTQLRIATQVSVIKVKVTVTQKENQFPLKNFSLFWPIDMKLGACNWCNPNNGILFSSLPFFISYSCHINTWLKGWKPGFVALRRFLSLVIFFLIRKWWCNQWNDSIHSAVYRRKFN